MRIMNINLMIFLGLMHTAAAWAAETVAPVSEVSKTAGSDLDSEISDIKLRAISGAKSKISSTLTFTYAGASLEKPKEDIRPNVGKTPYVEPVSFRGDLGLRFRRDKNRSYYLATGFYQPRPFHSRESDEKLDLNTPHIAYNKTHSPIDDLQLSSSVRLYVMTVDYQRDLGEVAMAGYSISALNRIGTSRFDGGISLAAAVTAFDKHDDRLRPRQQDYSVGINPTLQFNKGGWYNFYTALRLFSYHHVRSDDPLHFHPGVITQSLGAGMAPIRDIYLSPFLTFEPSHLAAKNTSVNLAATINL